MQREKESKFGEATEEPSCAIRASRVFALNARATLRAAATTANINTTTPISSASAQNNDEL